jgi:hypothetical protein
LWVIVFDVILGGKYINLWDVKRFANIDVAKDFILSMFVCVRPYVCSVMVKFGMSCRASPQGAVQ